MKRACCGTKGETLRSSTARTCEGERLMTVIFISIKWNLFVFLFVLKLWRIGPEVWSTRLQEPMGQSALHRPEGWPASAWSNFRCTSQKKSSPKEPVYSERKRVLSLLPVNCTKLQKHRSRVKLWVQMSEGSFAMLSSTATPVFCELLVRVGQNHSRRVNGDSSCFNSVCFSVWLFCCVLRCSRVQSLRLKAWGGGML